MAGTPARVETLANPLEVSPARLAQRVDEGRGVGGGGQTLGPLAVEHPQRVGGEVVAMLGAEVLGVGLEVVAQSRSR